MILEVATLYIKQGQDEAFQLAITEAKTIISASPGFRRLSVRPCLEKTHQYLLEVEWETVEDHTIGFRASPAYQRWKDLLHDFYEPFPIVEHYGAPLITA